MVAEYQAALAQGDLGAARNALSRLVQIDDGNAEYFAELGRISLQTQDLAQAFNNYSRAYELDRSNVDYARTLAQLALQSGDLERAQKYADELSLLAPGDASATLISGYAALRPNDLAASGAAASKLLANAPDDPSALILKARTVLRQGHPNEAIALLTKQVANNPNDLGSQRALLGMQNRQDLWVDATATGRALFASRPGDPTVGQIALRAALRSGNLPVASEVTTRLLNATQDFNALRDGLRDWEDARGGNSQAAHLVQVARSAPPLKRAAIASHLVDTGQLVEALAIVKPHTQGSIKPQNLNEFAVYGNILRKQGKSDAALDMFNRVLALDLNNTEALTGRALLYAATNRSREAKVDAERLVASQPQSTRARIVMAQVLDRVGDHQEAERELWQSFHDIPGDAGLYALLRRYVAEDGIPSELARLEREYNDQRDVMLNREFI